MVGGALMVPTKDIVDNAVQASNVTTVVALVGLAGLVDTLKSEGPFTVFAPTNDAFAKVDAATVASLQEPENKAALANVLTYHVVAGAHHAAALVEKAHNSEVVTTVQGGTISFALDDAGNLWVVDANGGKAKVETADVVSSNGVTHVIDSVLMPQS